MINLMYAHEVKVGDIILLDDEIEIQEVGENQMLNEVELYNKDFGTLHFEYDELIIYKKHLTYQTTRCKVEV